MEQSLSSLILDVANNREQRRAAKKQAIAAQRQYRAEQREKELIANRNWYFDLLSEQYDLTEQIEQLSDDIWGVTSFLDTDGEQSSDRAYIAEQTKKLQRLLNARKASFSELEEVEAQKRRIEERYDC